jgi:hypothetical protein
VSGRSNDAAFDSDGNLEPIPYFGGMAGYTHHWTGAFRSTASYGYVHLDNKASQAGTAYHLTPALDVAHDAGRLRVTECGGEASRSGRAPAGLGPRPRPRWAEASQPATWLLTWGPWELARKRIPTGINSRK